ncbi:hypothetical protein BDV98DRAFT_345923 [Pterulicium gracile]|uniref:Uncharacterized protein n=1 Tax=Pterulicium gracile TaxID=1884261 RepID=A0A5C3Q1R7_9AGAR|nr:hypothetical protein BDV98DRAFT_345923 [Pterula gracilis]
MLPLLIIIQSPLFEPPIISCKNPRSGRMDYTKPPPPLIRSTALPPGRISRTEPYPLKFASGALSVRTH